MDGVGFEEVAQQFHLIFLLSHLVHIGLFIFWQMVGNALSLQFVPITGIEIHGTFQLPFTASVHNNHIVNTSNYRVVGIGMNTDKSQFCQLFIFEN